MRYTADKIGTCCLLPCMVMCGGDAHLPQYKESIILQRCKVKSL
jgi:hypothetical protein